jgi:hypothetical protein
MPANKIVDHTEFGFLMMMQPPPLTRRRAERAADTCSARALLWGLSTPANALNSCKNRKKLNNLQRTGFQPDPQAQKRAAFHPAARCQKTLPGQPNLLLPLCGEVRVRTSTSTQGYVSPVYMTTCLLDPTPTP